MTELEAGSTAVADLAEFRQRAHTKGGQSPSGGGPTDGIEQRVTALEKSVEKIDGKLDKLIEGLSDFRLAVEQRFASAGERLASIEGKLEAKASAVDLAEAKGRVNSLPTTWQLITVIVATVFTILGGAFLILKFGLPHAP